MKANLNDKITFVKDEIDTKLEYDGKVICIAKENKNRENIYLTLCSNKNDGWRFANLNINVQLGKDSFIIETLNLDAYKNQYVWWVLESEIVEVDPIC